MILWLLAMTVAAGEDPAPSRATKAWDPAEIIAAHNVPGTPAGAAELLRQLATSTSGDIDRWVRELEADEYDVRELATNQLARLPAIPRQEWLARLPSETPERKWRLRNVLERHARDSTQVYRAALQLLARDPSVMRGEDWLAAALILERPDLRDEYAALLRQHVTVEQLAEFRSAVKSPRSASRLASAVVMSRSDSPADAGLVDELLRDTNDQVALIAAQGLTQRGPRGLATLIRLLDSPQLDVRREAAAWLCGTTGQEFDYSPFAKSEDRQLAMTRWREWLAGPGAMAIIQPPQRMAVHGRGDLGGNTLIATGGLGKISELDERGQVVWQHAMQAWSAEKLPGGHILVASHWENRVCELDERGKVVWEHAGINAIRAKPLPGGRALIADFSGNRVVEADQQGTTIWQHETPDQCFDAERLTSGNTLFACPNLIREVSPSGETVRQWTCEGRVNSLQVLPSGRLLIANYGQGRIVELDDTGRVTWEHKIPRPSDAFRLPGGRTLITTAEQIVEVDLAGRTIREISAAVNGGARQ